MANANQSEPASDSSLSTRLPRRQVDALRRLRPRRRHQPDRRRLLRDEREAGEGRQVLRHRLLDQDARLLPGPRARLQRVHGRMPAVATGAMLANHKLICIGVTGDGDTASIGLGQFMHLVRRNIPIIYIIENNGVYGLTKGQFSADGRRRLEAEDRRDQRPPADGPLRAGRRARRDVRRALVRRRPEADGEPPQGRPRARGTAMLDVISPCVTFNDHDGSTKGYAYSKEHDDPLQDVGFVQSYEQIEIDYEPGTMREVTLHDGSRLLLKKLEEDYDPTDNVNAMQRLPDRAPRRVATGLIYLGRTATISSPSSTSSTSRWRR